MGFVPIAVEDHRFRCTAINNNCSIGGYYDFLNMFSRLTSSRRWGIRWFHEIQAVGKWWKRTESRMSHTEVGVPILFSPELFCTQLNIDAGKLVKQKRKMRRSCQNKRLKIAQQAEEHECFVTKIVAAMHRSGVYKHLMNEEDVENLKWLQIFNKHDL
ncbi:unnamed protein product [Lactuca virosa]|uniref:Uncharacterized protein n=1 Tax=Lactuca virosa TaxID=75947 RepID=A0AAU9MHH8_9ASTR|nr:unnamed protein product [Lactuca virosa]